MFYRIIAAAFIVLLVTGPLQAEPFPTTDPEARKVAIELLETMRVSDNMQAILPQLMQQFKRPLTEGRPEVERDFDRALPLVLEIVKPRLKGRRRTKGSCPPSK